MKFILILEDKMIWKENKAGSYSVKLMYGLLNFDTPMSFHVQSIWNPLVPIRVGFFFFFLLGRLLGARS